MRRDATDLLLTAGILAGVPSGVICWTLALTRDGFDVTRNANSQLVLGDWGWIQTANFLTFGILLVALAVGIWRAAGGKPGGRVAAVGIGVYGVGAGIVVAFNPTDPMFGFPPGSPPGYPGYDAWSTAAKVHGTAGSTGFLAVTVACFAMARYFASSREQLWTWWSLAVGTVILTTAVYLALNSSGETESFQYLPTWIVGSLGWIYLSASSWKLRTQWRASRSGQR